MSAPERIWAQPPFGSDWDAPGGMWWPFDDAALVEYVRADVSAAAIAAARREGLEAGYLAGFNSSGEGWNGEYPFSDDKIEPTTDADWLKRRDTAIRALMDTPQGNHFHFGSGSGASPRTYTEAEVAAMVRKAWGLAMEAAASVSDNYEEFWVRDIGTYELARASISSSLRALTPPADLLDHVKGGDA